jgi:hypothetical protein
MASLTPTTIPEEDQREDKRRTRERIRACTRQEAILMEAVKV